jgi:malonyl CoA-acyl carrier protein transacylase
MSAYLNDLVLNNKKLFLQFGGQGAPYFKELLKYYQEPAFGRFFSIAIDACNKAVAQASERVLPCEFQLEDWLKSPDSAPDDNVLSVASISLGLIQVTQFAHFEYLNQQGFDREKMLNLTAASSGHSQGLIPAAFTALSLTGNSYEEALSLFIEYLFLMGIRAQEVHPTLTATDEETSKSETLGSKNPAPMVAVLGLSHEEIESKVNDVNSKFNEVDKIYVSLYNSPSNRIISGPRHSLIKFHELNQEYLKENEVKYVYLRTTCPFHCEQMTPIREPFYKDIDRIGFSYKGSDLKFPVISFFDGDNLQGEESLGKKLCEDLMINTLYWDKAIKGAMLVGSKNILDFGPGKTSQRLTMDTLAGLSAEAEVLSVANPKDQKVLL